MVYLYSIREKRRFLVRVLRLGTCCTWWLAGCPCDMSTLLLYRPRASYSCRCNQSLRLENLADEREHSTEQDTLGLDI
ncbi:hypothetical protein B9Z19DRAFT_477239 [Tuber borchii]|uniref:Uncharacterized protein n=1 Tax=Tuber borchii TaxID=42251 RepID=A0A2T7A3B1_TUBBO|nr:hypothetical protein B9Z19DRAFT_477239 [Tuber borchii]